MGDKCDADIDEDGIGHQCDVCPNVVDYLQRDTDEDGAGDGCDPARKWLGGDRYDVWLPSAAVPGHDDSLVPHILNSVG